MFKMSKAIVAGALVAAFAAPSYAALTNVAGVVWDPSWVGNDGAQDFSGDSSFVQWFQTTNDGVDTSGAIGLNQGNATTAIVGNYLYGVGKFNNFNAANDIVGQPNPETTPATFCPGCELTYEFGGIKLTENTGTVTNPIYSLDLTGAYFKVWVDPAKDFDVNNTSTVANATNGTLFLEGIFDTFLLQNVSLTGNLNGTATLAGTVNALLSVTGGAAFANFDTNTIINPFTQGLSDLFYSASSQFNLPATGTRTFSNRSTGEFQGDTVAVPEPGTIALLGGALLGLAFTRRRRS